MSCRDALLRPVALDLPVMMNLIHENNLVSKLEIFQQQVFEMFHYETCTPCQILNMKLFDNIMDEYQEVVTDYWMSLNK